MNIAPFKLERYFALHEFSAKYMMSSSDCDGFPMEYVLKQATSKEKLLWDNLHLGYTESPGSPLLREAICRFYTGSCPDNVVVASPGELLFITMNLLMQGCGNPHAVVVGPAYQSLCQILDSLGCRVSAWKPERGDWSFSVERLRELVSPETRVIVINFPHNPSGSYITREQMEEIVDIARSCGAYLYSDEMYRDLLIDGDCKPLPPAFELYEKGISLWGMAKSFALAGLRIGWVVTKDTSLLQGILSFKDYLSMCCSAPSEVLATIALNHAEKFIQPNIEKIKGNIALFRQAIDAGKLPWVEEFIPPKAGSVAFVKINLSKTEELLGCKVESTLKFSDALVQKYGIMTVPAELFDYEGSYLRIGFGRKNFREILEILAGN